MTPTSAAFYRELITDGTNISAVKEKKWNEMKISVKTSEP